MKRMLLIAIALTFWVAPALAQEMKKEKPVAQCPKTKMQESCLDCHIKGSFKVRETAPDAHLTYPHSSMKITGWDTGKLVGYYLLQGIDASQVKEFLDYLTEKKISQAIIEIHSPGGSLFGGQRIVSLMQRFQAEGGSIETRVNGFAASAGFLVFVAGDKGKRFVSAQADLMWHELLSLKGIGWVFETPSDSEESARILRHLQNVRNEWLATRGKLSKKEIDDLIRKKEFWMSGKDAVSLGFADGFIGK